MRIGSLRERKTHRIIARFVRKFRIFSTENDRIPVYCGFDGRNSFIKAFRIRKEGENAREKFYAKIKTKREYFTAQQPDVSERFVRWNPLYLTRTIRGDRLTRA